MTPGIDTTNFRQILADPQDIPAVGTSVDLSMLPKYDTEIKPSPFLQSVRLDFFKPSIATKIYISFNSESIVWEINIR